MLFNFFENIRGIYFIGCGGISMSALAEWMLSKGVKVSGSDSCPNERCKRLQEMGATVYFPQAAENITDENVVVYSSAISKDHAEYRSALRRGKLMFSRAEFLDLVGKSFFHTIYVAGCHGKTTTTAMLAHIFSAAGRAFTLHLGGEDVLFGNFYGGGTDYFISEACEYQKNILKLYGETAIVLNTELDHGECYSSPKDLEQTYYQFLSRANHKILPFGQGFSDAITFSLYQGDYTAEILSSDRERYRFRILERGKSLGVVRLNVYGKHHVGNALAACAAARCYGIDGGSIVRGLEAFLGVKRRFERIGSYRQAEVVCDYAHHPTELSSSIAVGERITAGKLFLLFQPHTYSRTKLLFDDFLSALRGRNVLILPTYAAREEYDEAGDARRLARMLSAPYAENREKVKEFLSFAGAGDTVLALGAGDIYERMKELLRDD